MDRYVGVYWGVLSGEPPVYDGASIVALAFERGDLPSQLSSSSFLTCRIAALQAFTPGMYNTALGGYSKAHHSAHHSRSHELRHGNPKRQDW